MNQPARPPLPTIIPESAPFSPEQRNWLNGFFAGFVSLDDGVTALSSSESAGFMGAAAAKAPLGDGDDGEAPWHDQTLPMAERMKLAGGRPLRRRMMAAMAQQDCGQCGYNCQDYSNALFLKKEERLNLCVPGGKETVRMLKQLDEEFLATAPAGAPAVVARAAEPPAGPKIEAGRPPPPPLRPTFLPPPPPPHPPPP